MKIKTTMFIRKDLLTKIVSCSISTGLSVSELIARLLEMIIMYEKKEYTYNQVKYQERDDEREGKRQHVGLHPLLYEKTVDMRKIFKKSVSLLLAEAVEKYLEQIIGKILSNKNSSDNYPHSAYNYQAKFHNNRFYYIINWQLPPEDQIP